MNYAKKTITVRIAEGIGNQLFMYANAYNLSKKFNYDLSIDNKSGYFKDKNSLRTYQLNNFHLDENLANSKNRFDTYLKDLNRKILKKVDKFSNFKKFLLEKKNSLKKTSYYEINLNNYSNKIFLEGHFESEKYFYEYKKNLKNIFKDEFFIEDESDSIDYNLLSNFLDKNIFKIEKLIGNFLKSILLIIENKQILNLSIGIKKLNYGEKINKQYLQGSLAELKDLFNQSYQNNKIMHFIINKYLIDGVNYKSFDEEIDGENICVEVNFISIPNTLNEEISDVLAKYQIKIDRLLERKYVNNFFEEKNSDLSVSAFKIHSGQNYNEIGLMPKSKKKKGFFEKFFQLFS